MPIKHAAHKYLRKSRKLALKNRKEKDTLRDSMKAVRKAILAKDYAKATDALKRAIKALDKGRQHGVIKRNTAARKKSRLQKAVNALKKA